MTSELKGLLFASSTALLWGFLAIFLKFALFDLDSLTIVWFRFFTAFIIITSIFSLKNPSYLKILYKPPFLLIPAALGLSFNYLFYLMGLDYTNPSIVNIIIQIGPVMLATIGILVYKEKISFRQALGFLVALVGLAIFYWDQLNSGGEVYKDLTKGVIITLAGAVSWVVYAALQKKLVKDHSAQKLNMFIYFVPTIIFIPWVDFQGFTELNTNAWLVLVFLGLNTLLAYGGLGEALKYAPANKVSIIITLNPMITLVAMAVLDTYNFEWLGKEMTSVVGYTGAALVVIGAILVVLRRK